MIPHDQRRFDCVNARLLELEVVCEQKVNNVGFVNCDGYAIHGDIPQNFQPFDGVWRCSADQHAWLQFEPLYLHCGEQQSLMLEMSTGSNAWDATNPQMLLFYDGKSVRGVDTNHRRFAFPNGVKTVNAYVYSGMEPVEVLAISVKFLVRDERVHALQNKISALCDILSYASAESKLRAEISDTLKRAVNVLNFCEPYSQEFYDSIAKAEQILQGLVDNQPNKPNVWAVGHTHIDIAWLWTVAQTREKALRSFGTALSLMDEHPEYKFMSSQPILYQFVKEQDAQMFERIKQMVRQGRWDPEGSMWVEPDCNLTSGESLVRQILVGKQFFNQEFGVDNKVLWLPDVFGYSAALPQILKKSGVETFITSKISWNDTNRMPHEIFDWQGVDGTTIPTYFMTTQRKVKDMPSYEFITYNGEGTPAEVEGTYFRLTDKHLTNDVLMPTGFGDGGGGTTPKMIECINYLSQGVKGCARVKFSTTGEFFAKLKQNLNGKIKPRWVGELYLEFHRGTYTSIAKNKRNNRKAEFAMWNSEWLGVLAKLLCGKSYPTELFAKHLKTILTNQFHDILPGSSIEQVYEQTDKEYAKIFADLGNLQQSAQSLIAQNVDKAGLLVFNPNSCQIPATLQLDGKTVSVGAIPSKGYQVVDKVIDTNTIFATPIEMENDFFAIKFNEKGHIVSLIDKRCGKQVVAEGGVLNKIIAYENLPFEFDNWELKPYYAEKPIDKIQLVNVEVVNDGVRKGVKFTRKFYNSTIWQTVWLYQTIERIDFETKLDWHEHHIILRSESETTIHADQATYDIQFGSVQRATNDNTSWDKAKFETCAHKYVDISQSDYGVSLLNDCKYGHSVRGGKIGLSLLTCGTYPNPNADQGEHIFTYSLMPHVGDYKQAGVIAQAYMLNNPLTAVKTEGNGNLPSMYSFVSCNSSAVIIETVKQSEDGNGVIVRAYESFGGQAKATFKLGCDVVEIHETDLLENKQNSIANDGNTFQVELAPFEIKTFYIKIK